MSKLKSRPSDLKFYSRTFLTFYRNVIQTEGRQRKFLMVTRRILQQKSNNHALVVQSAVETRFHNSKFKRISRANAWRIWCLCRESRAIRSKTPDASMHRMHPAAEKSSPAPVVKIQKKKRRTPWGLK